MKELPNHEERESDYKESRVAKPKVMVILRQLQAEAPTDIFLAEDEHKNIGPSRRVHNGFFLSFRTLYLQSTLTEISVAPPSFSQGAQPSQAHR